MILFSHNITSRSKYVIDHLNEHFFAKPIKVTNNLNELQNEHVLNYSTENISGAIQVIPEGLLFETGIREFSKDPFVDGDNKDIFSLIFHCLSRYEEYQIKDRDNHGRFQSSSLSREKQRLIEGPFLDRKIIEWVKNLEDHFKIELLSERRPKAVCSFDIDVAYAYKARAPLRMLGSKFKDVFRGDKKRQSERKDVVSGKLKDPFDTYDLQEQVSTNQKINTKHFFLLSNDHKYDHAISPNSDELNDLVNRVSRFSQVGIHPSYNSHSSFETLKNEVRQMETILKKSVSISRQHYLKFELPRTYQDIIQCGIKEEYSMGFSNASLFRAGTCFPFYFYDLEKEEVTDLKVFPLLWMDSTYFYDESSSVLAAEQRLFQIIDMVTEVGGIFIANWHNDKLQETEEVKPWRDLFLKMIEKLGKAF